MEYLRRMATNDTAKWLPRVEALLRKAADRAATPAEAEAALAKAQELMSRFGIEDAMLRAATNSREPVMQISVAFGDSFKDAQATLMHYVCRANDCYVGWLSKQSGKYGVQGAQLFGTATNLEKVRMMFASTQMQMMRRTMGSRPTSQTVSVRAHRDSYSHGWAHAVGKRLVQMNKQAVESVPGAGLVLASESDRVKSAMEEEMASMRLSSQKPKQHNASAYHQGVRQGETEALNNRKLGDNARRSLGR